MSNNVLPDPLNVNIAQPLEMNSRGDTGIPVYIQDQTTSILDLVFLNRKGTFQLAANTTSNTRVFTALSGHGIVIGDVIELQNTKGFVLSKVLNVVTDTITIDSLIGDVYLTGVNHNRSTQDMRVDGSVTPVVFAIKPDSGQSGDINNVKFSIQDNSSMDFSTFGSAAALTVGCLLRYKRADGSFENIFNFKTNGDISQRASSHDFEDKIGGGLVSFTCKVTFNGQPYNGVAVRVDGDLGEELQLVVQDDLASISQNLIVATASGSGIQGQI